LVLQATQELIQMLGLNIRLTHRISAIGAVGVAGLMLVGGIYLIGASSQEHYRELEDQAQVLSSLVTKLSFSLVEGRRAEKDFFLLHDVKYANRHREFADMVEQDIEEIRKQASAANRSDLVREIELVQSGFKGYAKSFAAVVDGKRRLGLGEDSGLEGALRASVHAIETKLNEFDDPRLLATLLMMRRHEKDFMLRRSVKYGDDMKKRTVEFTTGLAASNIPPADKADILEKLSAYQKDFFGWMETAIATGRDQEATTNAYAAIEPLIEAMAKSVERTRIEAESASIRTAAATRSKMQIAILLVVVAVSAFAFLTGRTISRPLSAMTGAMGKLANGNFDVVLPGLGRKDEIGEMAQAVEQFKVEARERARRDAEDEEAVTRAAEVERKTAMHRLADEFAAAVGNIIETVSHAATGLEAAANRLADTAKTTQQLSDSVASASKQASSNVASVAAATEEMSASVNEIAGQVHESSRIAIGAVKQAQQTDARIAQLSQAASRIGDVIKLITAIAAQTNLLALNATIEAARAGEAGRGFAVVASEVKALANQTAKATEEIGTQIFGMQSATKESVAAITEISGTILRISEISSAIAAAVEEQEAMTREISRNVHDAADGTAQVATNVTDVNQGARETGSASAQVLSSAQSLSNDSSRLKVEVERFLAGVRAA
jgi:methyl-accepting chemotaxis protein